MKVWPDRLTAAYNRHCAEKHNQEYESCDDVECEAAVAEEIHLGLLVREGDIIVVRGKV